MMVYHKFQSLIGNVQRSMTIDEDLLRGDIMFQSLIGNVQPEALS